MARILLVILELAAETKHGCVAHRFEHVALDEAELAAPFADRADMLTKDATRGVMETLWVLFVAAFAPTL